VFFTSKSIFFGEAGAVVAETIPFGEITIGEAVLVTFVSNMLDCEKPFKQKKVAIINKDFFIFKI
jgi:hypothetical protein